LRPPFPDLFQSLIVNTRDSIAAGTSWNHSSAQKMYEQIEQIMNKCAINACHRNMKRLCHHCIGEIRTAHVRNQGYIKGIAVGNLNAFQNNFQIAFYNQLILWHFLMR
jgi:hypothetical protein